MPPLHLRNWTAFAFMAVIAMFVSLLTALLIGFNRGGPDVVFTILGTTLRLFAIGVLLVLLNRHFAGVAERAAMRQKAKSDQSGEFAEL
jgi:hypothetical protein